MRPLTATARRGWDSSLSATRSATRLTITPVVIDVFDPTMMADLMVEIGHRFDGVGITHEGNALSPLPHWHIPCATRELVHAAPQSRLAGAFAFAAKLGTRTRVLRRRNARGIVNPESSDRYCTP